jgi:membrane-bound ClpP family serine protease
MRCYVQKATPDRALPHLAWAGLLLVALAPGAALAQEGAGRVIRVPVPDSVDVTNRLREVTRDALDRFEAAERERDPKDRRTFKLIYDFNPDGKPNSSASFGACYDLAKYLRTLQDRGPRTIAYVHGEVTRHSVLPVLACQEIVFSSEAKLGAVVRNGEALPRLEREAYDDVARNRYPLALVRKMHDKNVVVVKARAGDKGDRYREQRDEPNGEVVLPAGDLALFTFPQAREVGLCQQEAWENVADLAAAYQLPRSSLDQDPLLGRTPVVWRIDVAGPINGELKEKVIRRVKRVLGQKANLIVFQLECGSGNAETAYDLADYLARLQEDYQVKTVAYVTPQAHDTAVFLALACNQIVMNKKARLGDFEAYVRAHPEQEKTIRENLMELARRQFYSPLLAQGMLDRQLRLHWVVSTRGASQARLMTEQELDEDRKGPNPHWKSDWRVKPATPDDEDRYLTLNADTAQRLGLARYVVEDLDGVYSHEGISPSQVQKAGTDRLDDLAEFLSHPWTSVVLIMLGITCLFLELKMPGVSLPGILAAVCFVLFFWSHSQLRGQMDWLALLLFALGLVLIGLEIFVLPGMGVAGFSGLILTLGSIGLVAYGHWPQTNEEWVGFGKALSPFGISLVGAVASAILLARYLPSIPFANRLFLKPAGETADDLAEASPDPARPDLSALLGAIGVAATPLRPAGKVQFGDDFLDVVADGGYVLPGTRVQVIEIEGNRVVVKEV